MTSCLPSAGPRWKLNVIFIKTSVCCSKEQSLCDFFVTIVLHIVCWTFDGIYTVHMKRAQRAPTRDKANKHTRRAGNSFRWKECVAE